MSELLDKAKSKIAKLNLLNYTPDDAALAVAWARGQITTGQAAFAWDASDGAIYAYLAKSLQKAVKIGLLK